MSANATTEPERAARSLTEVAYVTMRRRVIENIWPPGWRALEQELAAELGMSRTPVREALMRLQNEGLVDVVPRHGMCVLPISADDMRDIYDMLTALEAMAAELAARRQPDDAQLQPLKDATCAMERALLAEDRDEWARADEDFHRHLVALSGNRLLIDTVQNCWDRAHRARLITLRMRASPVHSTREHAVVVEKIALGDWHAAFEAHRTHRARAASELLAILDHYRIKTL